MRLSTILFLVILLQACQSTYLGVNDTPYHPLSLSSNLKFDNVTGEGATNEHIDSFISLAKYASLIYRDDIEKTMKYIKYRMDELYGFERQNFCVFIQTDQTKTSRYYWVNSYNIYAGLKGINPIYPKWSYFFSRGLGSKAIANYDFFSKDQKGNGIDQQLENLIVTLILSEEPNGNCICTSQLVESISQGLQQQQISRGLWTVICDDRGATSALVWSNDQQYISVKPKNCYYTIYRFI